MMNMVANFGPDYLRPFDLLNPFIARFGLRNTHFEQSSSRLQHHAQLRRSLQRHKEPFAFE